MLIGGGSRWAATVSAVIGIACASNASASAPDTLTPALNAFLKANPDVPGIVATVRSGDTGLDWSGAAGVADLAAGTRLTARHAFRTASVTKVFTSAAVLRLVETKRIDVDAPISGYLSPDLVATLRAGGYDPDKILVRHLLSHTSGLFDYAEAPEFTAAILAQPAKRWTRLEQVQFAVAHGKPLGAPGEVFGYSDTGYVLLGEIVERATGQPLSTAVRSLLNLKHLGLDETVWEDGIDRMTGPAKPPLFKSYIGKVDTSGVDASFDLYGGGGLVSTTHDLAVFIRAAARGELFADRRTLTLAMAVPAARREPTGPVYSLMGEWSVLVGEPCWGHTGFFGTFAFYCPASDATYVFHVGLGAAPFKLKPLLEALKSAALPIHAGPAEPSTTRP